MFYIINWPSPHCPLYYYYFDNIRDVGSSKYSAANGHLWTNWACKKAVCSTRQNMNMRQFVRNHPVISLVIPILLVMLSVLSLNPPMDAIATPTRSSGWGPAHVPETFVTPSRPFLFFLEVVVQSRPLWWVLPTWPPLSLVINPPGTTILALHNRNVTICGLLWV